MIQETVCEREWTVCCWRINWLNDLDLWELRATSKVQEIIHNIVLLKRKLLGILQILF